MCGYLFPVGNRLAHQFATDMRNGPAMAFSTKYRSHCLKRVPRLLGVPLNRTIELFTISSVPTFN